MPVYEVTHNIQTFVSNLLTCIFRAVKILSKELYISFSKSTSIFMQHLRTTIFLLSVKWTSVQWLHHKNTPDYNSSVILEIESSKKYVGLMEIANVVLVRVLPCPVDSFARRLIVPRNRIRNYIGTHRYIIHKKDKITTCKKLMLGILKEGGMICK